MMSSLISSGLQSLGETGEIATKIVDGKTISTPVLNGFGKDFMKATMLVAGGLSGGFSAVVAGGKFIDGFRQGLITAGLNHVAHSTFNKLESEDSFSQQQKEPWDTNGDGKISLSEANNWYRNGKGQAITLDASKVDLNFIDTTGWKVGETYGVQTLFSSDQGRVLGNINVKYLGNNQVTINQDTYNFEQHGSYLSSPIRNPANSIGRWWAGKGMEYKINFKGVNTIVHPMQPTRIYP